MYDAFCVHSKGSTYRVKSDIEALLLVRKCKSMLNEITTDIKDSTGITQTLNGPEGHVSAKTVSSVNMLEWGLQKLFENLKEFGYQDTNLLSCMTLDVENCHSTVHVKQANLSMLEYSRSFGQTMKESVKRVTKWAAYYHTSRKTWYPKPEEGILFSQVPTMNPLPVVEMSQADCDVLRNWVSSYGAAVRQRTVRQETTMAKHGTLPEFMYQRHCVMLDQPITFVSGYPEQDMDNNTTETTDVADNDSEIIDEFDPSSDEEISSDEISDVSIGEVGRNLN